MTYKITIAGPETENSSGYKSFPEYFEQRAELTDRQKQAIIMVVNNVAVNFAPEVPPQWEGLTK